MVFQGGLTPEKQQAFIDGSLRTFNQGYERPVFNSKPWILNIQRSATSYFQYTPIFENIYFIIDETHW